MLNITRIKLKNIKPTDIIILVVSYVELSLAVLFYSSILLADIVTKNIPASISIEDIQIATGSVFALFSLIGFPACMLVEHIINNENRLKNETTDSDDILRLAH